MNDPRRSLPANVEESTRFDLPLPRVSVGLNLDTPTREFAGSYDAPTAIVSIPAAPVQAEMTLFSPLVGAERPALQVTAPQHIPAAPQHIPAAPQHAVLGAPIRPLPVLDLNMRTQAEALVLPTTPIAEPQQSPAVPSEVKTARREAIEPKQREKPKSGTIQIILGAVAAAGFTLAAAFGGVYWQAHRQSAGAEKRSAVESSHVAAPEPPIPKVVQRDAAPHPVGAAPKATAESAAVPAAAPADPPAVVLEQSNALAVQAVEHLRAGRLEAALSAYRQLAQQFPDQRAYRLAAEILEKKHAHVAAKEAQAQ